MKNLNLIQLVKMMLFFSKLDSKKEYNEIKNILKQKYPDLIVLSAIKYLNGEYNKDEEIIFKDVVKGL
jgi:hypothetical protein